VGEVDAASDVDLVGDGAAVQALVGRDVRVLDQPLPWRFREQRKTQ
jgi:hypothetical protein